MIRSGDLLGRAAPRPLSWSERRRPADRGRRHHAPRRPVHGAGTLRPRLDPGLLGRRHSRPPHSGSHRAPRHRRPRRIRPRRDLPPRSVAAAGAGWRGSRPYSVRRTAALIRPTDAGAGGERGGAVRRQEGTGLGHCVRAVHERIAYGVYVVLGAWGRYSAPSSPCSEGGVPTPGTL